MMYVSYMRQPASNSHGCLVQSVGVNDGSVDKISPCSGEKPSAPLSTANNSNSEDDVCSVSLSRSFERLHAGCCGVC